MKNLLLAMMFITLVSCKEKIHTCEVIFTNSEKDTIKVRTIQDSPYLNEGDLLTSQSGYAIVSGVRSFRILKTEVIEK